MAEPDGLREPTRKPKEEMTMKFTRRDVITHHGRPLPRAWWAAG